MPQRSGPWVVIGAFVLLAIAAGVVGSLSAPDRTLWDVRRSSNLAGPAGMKGLADALQRLGVPVERRRRSFFGIASDSTSIDRSALLTIAALAPQRLGLSHPSSGGSSRFPTAVERRELMRYLRRGGALVLAGRTGLEGCLGIDVAWRRQPMALVLPADIDSVPPARYLLERHTPDSAAAGDGLSEGGSRPCTAPRVTAARILLRTTAGFTVARRLEFDGGGRVIIIADSRYLSNEFLRNTDAGALLVPLFLAERPSRVIFDEYHQGFGRGGSLYAAAFGWMLRSPGGWVILQLAFAGLLALAVAAIRFGPVRRLKAGRRRSPLEHLDALAVGLERAAARDAAVELILSGLRRRLGRVGYRPRVSVGADRSWLDGLVLAARSSAAHTAVDRLGNLARQHGGDEHVLDVATAVEDVWQALRQAKTHEPS